MHRIGMAVGPSHSASVSWAPAAQADALVLLFAAGFLTYWLALPAWVYLDSRSRNEPGWLWVLFVLITNLMGLLAYLLATTRPGAPTSA